ncbi:AN1-type zinc finger protein 3-like [Electrophorus electricus]|uniref:AN1-type zinc finger protein 3 n=1 Tax=Electrophorus electricus TaxID=8005 RepID=A0A4W4EU10_ELEEL|nr:AN1-type zinc finger protein 3-like [Electrophorus electricus]
MEDTGSERSKPPSVPPRCPCGFWGSTKTMNLCSKCFADIQKKQPDVDCSSKPNPASGSIQSSVHNNEASSSSSTSQALLALSTSPEESIAKEANLTSQEGGLCTDTSNNTLSTSAKRPCDSVEESVRKKARVDSSPSPEEPPGEPKQRTRRRCYRCQSKLELVQQELGSCRCGYVFCMRHRLPEQHDCMFDHQGRGRQEAVRNMVKLERKVGRSCQRIGEECS